MKFSPNPAIKLTVDGKNVLYREYDELLTLIKSTFTEQVISQMSELEGCFNSDDAENKINKLFTDIIMENSEGEFSLDDPTDPYTIMNCLAVLSFKNPDLKFELSIGDESSLLTYMTIIKGELEEYNDSEEDLNKDEMQRLFFKAIRSIDVGYDIFTPSGVDKTQLMTALELESNMETIQRLLDQGANVNAQDDRGNNSLYFAAEYCKDKEILQLLIDSGTNINKKNKFDNTPLIYAAQYNTLEIVSFLISNGAEVNILDSAGDVPLLAAALENHDPQVITILLKAGADINHKNNDGKTAVLLAAEYNNIEVIKTLIEAGADLDEKDNDGKSAQNYINARDELKELHKTSELKLNSFKLKEEIKYPEDITLLKAIMPNYVKWHKRLNLDWMEDIMQDNLQEIFKRAGYFYPQKSLLGLLRTPVNIERIKKAIIGLIPQQDNTYTLRTGIMLCALLEFEESVPLLIDVINENRCDDYDLALIFKTFMIMELDDKLLYWFDNLTENGKGDERIKRLHVMQLLKKGTTQKAQKAFELINEITEDNIKLSCLHHLSDIHKLGVDTSLWVDFIIDEVSFADYYNPIKAQWAITVGTEKVLRVILDLDRNTDLVTEIIYQAIAQPDSWKAIYPLLLEKKDEWMETDFDDNFVLAYMTLLGIWGEDFSPYRTNQDSWIFRCGAYLSGAGLKDNLNYTELLSEEDDSDVIYGIIFNQMLKKDHLSPIDTISFMALYNEIGYGFPRLTRSLLSGLNRNDIFPDINLTHQLETTRDYELLLPILNENPDFLRKYYFKYYNNIFSSYIREFSNLKLNMMFGLLSIKDLNIGFDLEELFSREFDYSKAESLLIITGVHDINFRSPMLRAKEKIHLSTETLRLNKDEFDNLYPYLFKENLDDTYRRRIIESSLGCMRMDPDKVSKIFRLVNMDTDLNDLVLKTITPYNKEPFIQDLLDSITGSSYAENIDLIINYHGFSTSFIPAIIHTCRSGSISKERSLELLILWLAKSEDEEETYSLLELISEFLEPADFVEYLKDTLVVNSDWSTRRSAANFVRLHPSPVYESVVFKLLKDDDSDVSAAAFEAISEILKREGLSDSIVCFKNPDGVDDDSFQTFYDLAKNNVTDQDEYKTYMGKQFILQLYEGESNTNINTSILQKTWVNLQPHFVIDFVDDKEKRIVGHIGKIETGEVLNWLLEQGIQFFYTVKKA